MSRGRTSLWNTQMNTKLSEALLRRQHTAELNKWHQNTGTPNPHISLNNYLLEKCMADWESSPEPLDR